MWHPFSDLYASACTVEQPCIINNLKQRNRQNYRSLERTIYPPPFTLTLPQKLDFSLHNVNASWMTAYDIRESISMHKNKSSSALKMWEFYRKLSLAALGPVSWSNVFEPRPQISPLFPNDGYLSSGEAKNCTVCSQAKRADRTPGLGCCH